MFFGLFDFAGRRNRKLRHAAKQGDRFSVRELLGKGADPSECGGWHVAGAREPE